MDPATASHATERQCKKCGSSEVDFGIIIDTFSDEPPIKFIRCSICHTESYYSNTICIPDDFNDMVDQNSDACIGKDSDDIIDLDSSVNATRFQGLPGLDENFLEINDSSPELVSVQKSRILVHPKSPSRTNSAVLGHNMSTDQEQNMSRIEYEEEFKIEENGNSADVDSKKVDENMKKIIEIVLSQPCCECLVGKLKRLCIDDCIVFQCENQNCNHFGGLDDTMNYFEFLQFLEEGDFQQAACQCGNSDLQKFKAHSVDTSNGKSRLQVKCDHCGAISDVNIIAGNSHNINIDDVIETDTISNPSDNSMLDGTHEADFSNMSSCSTYGFRYSCSASGELAKVNRAPDHLGTHDYVDSPPRHVRRKLSGDGSGIGRTKIKDIRKLKKGDHIAFHQVLGYWHHSLVIEVPYIEGPALRGLILVIHYNGPVSGANGGLFTKGVVVEEWIEVDAEKQELYRCDYSPNSCYSAELAIKNARSRLDEADYNIVTNNCEHFVRMCKTGHHRSDQSSAFWSAVKHYASVGIGVGKMVKSVGNVNVTKNGMVMGGKALNVAVSETGAVGQGFGKAVAGAAVSEGKQVVGAASGKLICAGVAVGMEVLSVCSNIMDAHKQRVAGNISRDEFVKITIKRSCEGGASLAAMALVIPLPQAWIGIPLAALMGRGVGCLLGRSAGAAWEKKWGKR